MSEKLIEHADEIARYAPPDHEGTANVRLVDRTFNGAFELVRGTVQPGGEAHAHAHDKEHQVSYIGRGPDMRRMIHFHLEYLIALAEHHVSMLPAAPDAAPSRWWSEMA